jgi:hypothetical protein
LSNLKDLLEAEKRRKEAGRYEDVSRLLLWMPNYTTDGALIGGTEHLEGKSPVGTKPTGRDQKV